MRGENRVSKNVKQWKVSDYEAMFEQAYDGVAVQDAPEAVEAYHPKQYVRVPGFLSSKAGAMPMIVPWQHDWDLAEQEYGAITRALINYKLAQFKVPTFYVRPKFLRGLLSSEPPMDMRLDAVRWPFDAVRFMIPMESILDFTFGERVIYLAGAYFKPGVHRVETSSIRESVSSGDVPVIALHAPVLRASATCPCPGCCRSDYYHKFRAEMTCREVVNFSPDVSDFDLLKLADQWAGSDLNEVHAGQFMSRMLCLLVKLLLTLQEQPHLVSSETSLACDDAAFHNVVDDAPKLWRPAFIGES